MIIVMKQGAAAEDVAAVSNKIEEFGYHVHPIYGELRTVLAAVGHDEGKARLESLKTMHGVDDVMRVLKPFKLCSREVKSENTIVRVGDVEIGGREVIVMAGPCSVESREQILEVARAVKAAGAKILRGGAFKPRTSPYSFQGLGREGLELLAEAREETGLAIVTELMDPHELALLHDFTDIIQIGARNIQNFALLKEVGKTRKPVFLKRGLSTTVEEWLMSAEYLMSEGNYDVVLCERGIRTFETATRNTLDLNAVPAVKSMSHLPVAADPAHGTGRWDLVTPMALAAVACGADALMIEVHPRPEEAWSDGYQSLTPRRFTELMARVARVAEAIGRTVAAPDTAPV